MPEQLEHQPRSRPAAEIHYQRAPRSWRTRFLADYRHWVRRTFSKESYLSSLKALLWVVPLSALIWGYAFNEQLIENNQPVTLQFANEPDRVVRFVDPSQQHILAKVKGPQKAVNTLDQDLGTSRVSLDLDRVLGPGRHSIELLPILKRNARFADVNVESCNPAEITVDIDSIVERTVEVRMPPDTPTGVQATFSNPKVKLSGPKSDLDTADPFVYVKLNQYGDSIFTPGQHDLKGVTFEVPRQLANSPIAFAPATESLQIDVSGNQETYVVPSMPVYREIPPQTFADSYRVTNYDSSISNVSIAGPKPIIEAIKRGDELPNPYALYAAFRVDISNPRAQHEAVLIFPDLPPGVTVTDKPRTVHYQLTQITDTQGNSNNP